MVRYLFAAVAALSMSSVQADSLDEIGTYAGQLRECFEKNHVSPQFNAETQMAIRRVVALRRLDRQQLNAAENASYQATKRAMKAEMRAAKG